MKKLSYKAGIITGLFLYALGAALFWPAAEIMNYTLFLVGLFIIAGRIRVVWKLPQTLFCYGIRAGKQWALPLKSLRKTFNSFGAIIAVVFGQRLILSNVPQSIARRSR